MICVAICEYLFMLLCSYFIITVVEVFCKRIGGKTLAAILKNSNLENLRMDSEGFRWMKR